MTGDTARLRMFAGPNGSGKSTVKNSLNKSRDWFGVYLNPDEIEYAVRTTGFLPLDACGVPVVPADLAAYFAASAFLRTAGVPSDFPGLRVRDGGIEFGAAEFNSYHASVLADFLRRQLLATRRSFTFETVMSSPDKVRLLGEAKAAGYRTYLYYIATDDPAINVRRVGVRVAAGGHDVPEGKIVERYARSLALLPGAVANTDRAFFFDTTGDTSVYFAEVTKGSRLTLHAEEVPLWFDPLLAKFEAGA